MVLATYSFFGYLDPLGSIKDLQFPVSGRAPARSEARAGFAAMRHNSMRPLQVAPAYQKAGFARGSPPEGALTRVLWSAFGGP